MCVVLGGPIQSVPSFGFPGLVSAIPCTSSTPSGPSRTKVQVRDTPCRCDVAVAAIIVVVVAWVVVVVTS